MGILERVKHLNKTLTNSEPQAVYETGIDKDIPYARDYKDLYKDTPHIVRRSVKNARYAATDPLVRGIITDIITKTNSHLEIVGDNQKAVDHIIERDTDWNISLLVDELIEKGIVDGTGYIEKWYEDNKLQFRFLKYDGKDFRIKEVYDEFGCLMGYKQVVIRNKKTQNGWRSKLFNDLDNDSEEPKEINFELEQIIPVKYNEMDGMGRSLVMNILDPVYYRRSLMDMMPKTVYKNSNILTVTMGNSDQPGLRLDKKDREEVVEKTSNYHKKGALIFPYGVEAKMVNGGSLPDIPAYMKYLESLIYIGLNTPEAVFTSESSNRATADIQLDSPTTGRVLFLQYNQEWVNRIVSDELFRAELDRNGFEGANVWLEFNDSTETSDEENVDDEESDSTGQYTDTEGIRKPITKKTQENTTRDTVAKQKTSGTDKVGGQVGGNSNTKSK